MGEDTEPARNIDGGPGSSGTPAEFGSGEPETRAEAVVDRLGRVYWQKSYGGRNAFECLVRTILSQNTSDAASQPAHDALLDRYGADDGETVSEEGPGGGNTDLVTALATADREVLADTIAGAGLHNQKSGRIIQIANLVLDEYGSEAAFDRFVRTENPETVRETLLEMNGVGPKTADCVLLFAGGREGVFPVDTHVHRIYRRLGIAPPDADHEQVRAVLERDVPPEKCGFGHTASIQFGREYCSARTPACLDGPEACPLEAICDKIGVDQASGDVFDPAEAGTSK